MRRGDMTVPEDRALATAPPPSEDQSRPSPPPKAPPWTASDWMNFFDKLIPFADRFLKLKEGELQHERAMDASYARSAWFVLGILMAFLAAVIALMSWLTFSGKVSGDALLFLVGTAAGYVLALVQRQLFPDVVSSGSGD